MADTWAIVAKIPNCGTCKTDPPKLAYVDAKTAMGSWSFMCKLCFGVYGTGLGLGKGQELLTEPRNPKTK